MSTGPNRSVPPKGPTLEEVAARAGVSRGTASRVVNNEQHVSASAREKVQQAIKELGYVPNRAARTLVTRRQEAVALVVSATNPALFSSPFFAEVIVGIDSVLAEHDLSLHLQLAGSDRGLERMRRQLHARRVDGVVLLPLDSPEPTASLVAEAGIPAVYVGKPLGFTPAYFVDADNHGGAGLAASHLLSSGRRRLATITGPLDQEVGVARLSGFQSVAGPVEVVPSNFEYSGGRRAMAELLSRSPSIDGVFAASDSMAAGALAVLAERGIRVPDDIAVVGFDDVPLALDTVPPLTTVRQPIVDLGVETAQMLLTLMHGQHPTPLTLPTELVVRESA